MKTFVHTDFTTVVAVLLSFLAVVLGFDGICGERERGTLRQVLANPIPRGIVVIAKLLGGMISLWVPLAVAFGLALLILLSNPDVAFAGEDWIRLGILFVLSCLFLGQVFALSLMISAFTRVSATSLILCLFAWLVGGVGYMNVLPALAQYGIEGRPWQEFQDQEDDVWRAYGQEIKAWEVQHPLPAQAYLECIEQDGILRYGHPKGYAWRQQRNAVVLDKQLELAKRVYTLLWANQETPAREVLLVDRWSVLSPFTNYRVLAKRLVRSTLDDHFFLAKAVRRYRRTFIEYLRGKKAFSSRRWFTDDPLDQEPMIRHPEEFTPQMLAPGSPFMKARMKWVQQQEAKAHSDPRRRLELRDLPKFGDDVQRSLAESLMVMTAGLAVLLLTFGLSVMITIVRFLRYDPR